MSIETPGGVQPQRRSSEPDPSTKLLEEFNSMGKIPLERLEASGLVRLFDTENKIYSLVTKEEYDKKCQKSMALLQSYEGYIFAHHLDRIYRCINQQELISDKLIHYIEMRGKSLKDAGVPPIFSKDLYDTSVFFHTELNGGSNEELNVKENLFPSIDFIIQYATGAYGRKNSAIAADFEKRAFHKKGSIPIQPANVKDVKDFRRVAFTPEGKINVLLIRDVISYMRKHFISQTEHGNIKHERNHYSVFLFLEKMLKDFKVESIQYKEWNRDLEVIKNPKWYLDFTLEDSVKIAKAYFNSIREKPTGKDRSIFDKMKILFPEMTEIVDRTDFAVDMKHVFLKAEAIGDYRQIPKRVFTEEPWRSEYLPKLEKFFIKKCEEILATDPNIFFITTEDFFRMIPNMPSKSIFLPDILKIFQGFRVHAAKVLTDEQFMQLFTGESGRRKYSSFITPRGHPTDEAFELGEYLEQRMKKLKP